VTAHLIATTLALLGASVIYGTDVFGALVLVPAAARARDESVADLLGWVHELGDRRMPAPGMVGLLGSVASAWLAPSFPTRALALVAGGAQVLWLVIYATVSAPLNRQLRAAARASETPPGTRAWQQRWGAVIWPRAALQAVAVAALLAAAWATP
jgi:hypothetical protein